MLYREIIAVCSEIHTKSHKYSCVVRTWYFGMLNLEVNIVTTGLSKANWWLSRGITSKDEGPVVAMKASIAGLIYKSIFLINTRWVSLGKLTL